MSGIRLTVPDFNHAVSNTSVTQNRHGAPTTLAVVARHHPEATCLQAIVSEALGGLVDSHTAASILLSEMEYQENTVDQNRPVRNTLTQLFVPEWSLITVQAYAR